MKTVTYLGQDFEVPDWAKWIAADMPGSVWVYENKPEWQSEGYAEPSPGGRLQCVKRTYEPEQPPLQKIK